MSSVLLQELERLDTEPAPAPAVCSECKKQMADAPWDASMHHDCDEPASGWVSVAGRYMAPPHDPNSPQAVERRSELKAILDEVFTEFEISDIAFCLRVTADDHDERDAFEAALREQFAK